MNTEKILNFLKIQTHYFCAYEATINDGERIKGSCIVINIRYFWKKMIQLFRMCVQLNL